MTEPTAAELPHRSELTDAEERVAYHIGFIPVADTWLLVGADGMTHTLAPTGDGWWMIASEYMGQREEARIGSAEELLREIVGWNEGYDAIARGAA